MQLKSIICSILIMSFSLAGCIGNETDSSDECENGTLDILTYDILALSTEMVDKFVTESGYCVNFIKEDDSGGILDLSLIHI